MSHPHRYYVVADTPGAGWVRGVFAQLGDGGPAEGENCKAPLSPVATPTAAPVKWACSFVSTEGQRQQLEAIENAGQIPAGVVFARCDASGPAEGVVRHTNWPGLAVGRVFDVTAALGLLGVTFTRTAG